MRTFVSYKVSSWKEKIFLKSSELSLVSQSLVQSLESRNPSRWRVSSDVRKSISQLR